LIDDKQPAIVESPVISFSKQLNGAANMPSKSRAFKIPSPGEVKDVQYFKSSPDSEEVRLIERLITELNEGYTIVRCDASQAMIEKVVHYFKNRGWQNTRYEPSTRKIRFELDARIGIYLDAVERH
jgi:hypothetical protein